jgi:hypothetical protein
MTRAYYLHNELDGLDLSVSAQRGFVVMSDVPDPERIDPLELAIFTMRLAIRLGVKPRGAYSEQQLPYDPSHDHLVFDAPVTSMVVGRRMRLLRGWQHYGSCIKGFNGLGLMSEHTIKVLRRLQALSPTALTAEKLAFLRSRRVRDAAGEARPVFTEESLAELTVKDLDALSMMDVALWKTFGARPIVCSTSSNMGISLHEALRFMQRARFTVAGRECAVLNDDEGWLIIWCPDEQADFMNAEKTEHLRSLEAEQPPLTVLHTYINRKQRDPGALKDALDGGGYFFPTNPQSKDELHNLLVNSLATIATERQCSQAELIADDKVQYTLRSMGCLLDNAQVVVRSGVEGGLYGLMVGYLTMLDEALARGDATALSTWNQASIGAALAAEVLADLMLRRPEQLSTAVREGLREVFPAIGAAVDQGAIGTRVQTRIHGVFDIANLQSLAQLLGVVVDRHLSGRGTAFVGLGSSSYANGNRCYEILKESNDTEGPFRGKETFHPATHTLSPVAQALVYADDLHRLVGTERFQRADDEQRVALIARHVRKPEPAGSAALSGYLLARLDQKTLSIAEIAYAMKLGGFDAESFMEFAGFNKDKQGNNWFLQEATEEGPYMEQFARCLLKLLEWDIDTLEAHALKERTQSRWNYRLSPLDPDAFEELDPAVHVCLTGDNTRQPRAGLMRSILSKHMAIRPRLLRALDEDAAARGQRKKIDRVAAVKMAFAVSDDVIGLIQRGLGRAKKLLLRSEAERAGASGQ